MEFLRSCDPGLAKAVIAVKKDIAYLSDIVAKFNKVNLFLQGNEVNLIKVKSALFGFKNKLPLYQRNLARMEFFQFFYLQQLDTNNKGIYNVDVETNSKHIQELHENMEVRFQDFFQLDNPNKIIDPFIIGISELEILEEELITLQNDFELKPNFNISYQTKFHSEIKLKYPQLWDRVKFFSLHFPAHT